MKPPLMFDLCCGLGGATEGFLAEGWDCIGVDIERHQYGDHRYPAQLWIQDIHTISGAQLRDADFIWASPPCQFFSYCAMPWRRAKELAAAVRADPARMEKETALFNACFRIQREASAAAGRHIPLIVENVRGANSWVGRSRWNFGSYHLWGDVPALMPPVKRAAKVPGLDWNGSDKPGYVARAFNTTAEAWLREGVKQRGSGAEWWDKALDERRKEATAIKNGKDWFGAGEDCSLQRFYGSKSSGRKFASAMIAKIPLPLSRWIAATYNPRTASPAA